MIPLKNPCWLCGHTIGVSQPSEILSLPPLIRCERCNANQGKATKVQSFNLFGENHAKTSTYRDYNDITTSSYRDDNSTNRTDRKPRCFTRAIEKNSTISKRNCGRFGKVQTACKHCKACEVFRRRRSQTFAENLFSAIRKLFPIFCIYTNVHRGLNHSRVKAFGCLNNLVFQARLGGGVQ